MPLAKAAVAPYNSRMDRAIIQIREATPDDAGKIAHVHEEAWRFAYQGIIPHIFLEQMIAQRGLEWWTRGLKCGGGMLLLTFNGTPQGYVAYGDARSSPVIGAGEIFELYLAPTFVGIGLGKRLFLAAREQLRQKGCHSLIVWALAENEPACAFYTRLGGERIACQPERFGDITLTRVAYLWPHKASRRTAKG